MRCDMSDSLLQSPQHEQGKRHFADSSFVSSLWYREFPWLRDVFLWCEQVVSPAGSIMEVGKQCRQAGSQAAGDVAF